MRFANHGALCVAMALLCAAACSAQASEDILIVEQEYKLLDTAKKGAPDAKDIRQVLYITKDKVAIDEFDSDQPTPTETYLYDLTFKRIVNIDHTEKKIVLDETFDERRAKIQKQIKSIQSEIDDTETKQGQKDKLMKMFATMVDGKREFAIVEEPGTKDIAGVACKTVKVSDPKDPAYPQLTLTLHPDLEMPYDNSEVLFLIKAVGEKMSQFLKSKQNVFSHVPMEMHIQTVEGGKIDTKVTKVTKMKLDAFDPKTRTLGNPFEEPKGYSIVRKLAPKEKPKEKAD